MKMKRSMLSQVERRSTLSMVKMEVFVERLPGKAVKLSTTTQELGYKSKALFQLVGASILVLVNSSAGLSFTLSVLMSVEAGLSKKMSNYSLRPSKTFLNEHAIWVAQASRSQPFLLVTPLASRSRFVAKFFSKCSKNMSKKCLSYSLIRDHLLRGCA